MCPLILIIRKISLNDLISEIRPKINFLSLMRFAKTSNPAFFKIIHFLIITNSTATTTTIIFVYIQNCVWSPHCEVINRKSLITFFDVPRRHFFRKPFTLRTTCIETFLLVILRVINFIFMEKFVLRSHFTNKHENMNFTQFDAFW